MEHVEGYRKRNGEFVHGYERRSHDDLTPHDREVDRRNGRKAGRARRGE